MCTIIYNNLMMRWSYRYPLTKCDHFMNRKFKMLSPYIITKLSNGCELYYFKKCIHIALQRIYWLMFSISTFPIVSRFFGAFPLLTLFPFVIEFLLIFWYYSGVWLFLLVLLHTCCLYVRGILYWIHDSCMWSTFPVVHTKWFLLF